ncbi:MAG TPA: hemerythrin domain-containing protein [Acidimicrobiales bacterium]|nr:hemerythrin domain-containing protein [Acidimicrobiales bacterium]
MDAVTFLTKEHEKAKALFDRIKATDDVNQRQQLTAQVIKELRAHTKIEEEVLYPLVREDLKGGSKMFEEAMQEHQEAKEAMKELESMSPTDPEWMDKFDILMHGVLHHAGEEETEMFPMLQELLSEQRLNELGEQLEADERGLLVIDLSKDELLAQAKAADIDGRSKMDKAELEEALGHR